MLGIEPAHPRFKVDCSNHSALPLHCSFDFVVITIFFTVLDTVVPEILIKGLNSTAVKISWTYSAMFNVKRFKVELKTIPGDALERSEVVSADTREITFTGLGKLKRVASLSIIMIKKLG